MPSVLLAVDKDESRARSQAKTVVNLFDPDETEVEILHVFEENPEGASAQQIGSVRRAREVLVDAGIETSIMSESGDPTDGILSRARAIDADAIAIAGRKRSPAGKMVFGSVTQDVILSTERSVLVCKPDEET